MNAPALITSRSRLQRCEAFRRPAPPPPAAAAAAAATHRCCCDEQRRRRLAGVVVAAAAAAGSASSTSASASSSSHQEQQKQQQRRRRRRTAAADSSQLVDDDARQPRQLEQARGGGAAGAPPSNNGQQQLPQQQQQKRKEEPPPQQHAAAERAWYERPASAAGSTARARGPSAFAAASSASAGRNGADDDPRSGPSSDGAVSTSKGSSSSGSSSSSSSSSSVPPSAALPDGARAKLRQYMAHLLDVNQSMNLTAVRDPDEAWQRHVEDSLALLPAIERHLPPAIDRGGGALRVVDVGTGAGLPGVVLAVARPAWRVTLLDSLQKRCRFLEGVVELLELDNVDVVWGRAEAAGRRAELRDAHDLAVARAVAELRVLAELCLPLVAPGGLWVAAKGAAPDAEVGSARRALAALNGRLVAVEPVDSWAPEGQRTAVVVSKRGATPSAYPRSPGKPAGKPL